jgi:hypothetical protein
MVHRTRLVVPHFIFFFFRWLNKPFCDGHNRARKIKFKPFL